MPRPILTILLTIFLYSLLYTHICGEKIQIQLSNSDSSNDTDQFVATHEWQVVKPGQKLPPGLHVQQSMKTNEIKAKLMGPADEIGDDNSTILVAANESSIEPPQADPKLLEASANETDAVVSDEDADAELRSRFRSYDELKEDLAKINAAIKTDGELMDELMTKLKMEDTWNEQQTLNMFEDLSYLLHQIDNGRDFADKGGFTLLVRYLTSPVGSIKQAALTALGAAVQGNAKAKIVAMKTGMLSVLQVLLTHGYSESMTNDNLQLITRQLATLSMLLRDFPSAQYSFFFGDTDPTGFDLLSKLYSYSLSMDQTNDSIRFRVRLLTLLSDVAAERAMAQKHSESDSDETAVKLWELYRRSPFDEALRQSDWCNLLHQSLTRDLESAVPSIANAPPVNHDRREKLLTAVLHLYPICDNGVTPQPFDQSHLDSQLEQLEKEYSERKNEHDGETDDLYFSDMLQLVSKVRQLLPQNTTSHAMADEL